LPEKRSKVYLLRGKKQEADEKKEDDFYRGKKEASDAFAVRGKGWGSGKKAQDDAKGRSTRRKGGTRK